MESLQKIKNGNVRRHFNDKSREWYFSVVDILAVTIRSSDPRNYWKTLKNRLKKEQNQLVTSCNQLKLRSSDGKFYLTDVADKGTILGIIKLVSPEYIISLSEWFDTLESAQSSPTSWQTDDTEASYPQAEEELLVKVDGYSEKNFFIVKAFIAGVEAEDIFISVNYDTLTIKGEHKPHTSTRQDLVHPGSQERFLRTSIQELAWGKFFRTINLPAEVDIDQVQAFLSHGEVTIKLPIIDKKRARLVKVKSPP